MDIIKRLCDELNLEEKKVSAAVKLIDEGNTIPFIARYRKDVTGNLDDAELRNLFDRLNYLRNLDERINTVLKSIEEQGKLTDELKKQIENVKTLAELEDLYRPYKPKKKTRGSIAKEKGLEPLAKIILEEDVTKDLNEEAKKYINEEKKVLSVEDAINGAKDIVSEVISDDPLIRKFMKDLIEKKGSISSKEVKKDERDTYKIYADYQEPVSAIKPHRYLAINRGENEKCLKVALVYDDEEIITFIRKRYNKKAKFFDIYTEIINDSLKRLIKPSVENEIRSDLFDKASEQSFGVFKKNLKSLLMYLPLKNKDILGFDPGFRTGCKYALIDKLGNPNKKVIDVSYITANSKEQVEISKRKLLTVLKSNHIDYIALGNGTASRESEAILSELIKENNLPMKVYIVNESGASVYSASKLGEEEFPELPVEKRSAISLARRLMDPLSELVKIDPKAIGVGQYQHDLDQKRLGEVLGGVVEDCVNTVGVNLNTASVSLLKYVSGINKTIAQNIYNYREEHGEFKNREELKKVPKLGEKAYEQCAGFLRIVDGEEPLDNTGVHPESYKFAKGILKEAKIDLKVGMILTGTVRNIADFGAFVDINVHQDGLVHISEIANKFIRHPSEVLSINDIVKVKVISVDPISKRIGLSIKQAK